MCIYRPTVTSVRPSVLQGHITITNYLLNYYSGLDVERRNCHGFTALMKAAMQGRVECVRSLMMAGEENGAKCTKLESAGSRPGSPGLTRGRQSFTVGRKKVDLKGFKKRF